MKKRGYSSRRNQTKLALLFISPWVLGFLAFSLYPIVMTLYYSFTDFNLFTAPKFVGMKNYLKMLSDPYVKQAIYNSAYHVLFCVSLQMMLAIFTAVLLNMDVKGKAFFRTACYLPALVPPVAGALIWVWMLNPQHGLVNTFFRLIHLPEPLWFSSPMWSKPAIILIMLWGVGNTMVVYLAGIGDIPRDYYEAMDIDGANAWSKFWKITWPMLTPVTMFQLINGIILGFNMFTQGYIVSLTKGRGQGVIGGEANSLLYYASNLYRESFTNLKFGYASAQAWFMLVFVLLITILIIKTSKHWVYYGGEK